MNYSTDYCFASAYFQCKPNRVAKNIGGKMKSLLLRALILTAIGTFSNGAWARCCGDTGGAKPCYPKCIVATETGWTKLVSNHDNDLSQREDDTFDFRCGRPNPRSGARTCCAYKNGIIHYCTAN